VYLYSIFFVNMVCVMRITTGEKIRIAREAMTPPWSQYDLERQTGISRAKIANWEANRTQPKDGDIRGLGQLFGINIEWFYDGEVGPPKRKSRATLVEETPPTRVLSESEMSRAEALLASGQFVAIPVWRGAICGAEDEFSFTEDETPTFAEVSAFYTVGRPEEHVLCIASGVSMEPRIEHGAKVLIRLDPNAPAKKIVAASDGRGSIFLKRLMRGPAGLELHSLNDRFPPITNLSGWTLRGGVTMIQHPYNGAPNIEWDEGRFLF